MDTKARGRAHAQPGNLGERYFGLASLCCRAGVPLEQQPHLGHNRWHPDIEPKLYVSSGDEVVLEAIDPFNAQLTHEGELDELEHLDLTQCHPLTGPVYVEGAEPGDLLEVEILGVEPLSGKAFSNIFPGLPGWLGERSKTG